MDLFVYVMEKRGIYERFSYNPSRKIKIHFL